MLTDSYPPSIGGLQIAVHNLGTELRHRGHDVAVVTLWQNGLPEHELMDGLRVYRIAGWNRVVGRLYENPEFQFHVPAPDPGIMRRLHAILRRESPDIIHSHSWIAYSLLGMQRPRAARIVHTAHDFSPICAKTNYLDGRAPCTGPHFPKCVRCAGSQYGPAKAAVMTTGLRLSRPLHRRVDRFVAISTAVADALEPVAEGTPVTVIPSFIPDDVVARGRATERPDFLPEADGYLLFVGALGWHKGIDVLLDAYRLLRDPPPLVLIGTPRADSPRDFPPGVRVVHNVPNDAVMRCWLGCAIGVVPSVGPEALGLVAVEAMAAGRPVVASDVGGLRDVVIDGETGRLVTPDDPHALAEAIQQLLDDPDDGRRMGAAGAARAPAFSASAATDRLEALYRELMATGR